jgi:hypothetical protein
MTRIYETTILKRECLNKLIADEICVLVIKKYTSEEVSEKIRVFIRKQCETKPYIHDVKKNGKVTQEYYGVDRIGTPFNLIYSGSNDPDTKEQYYLNAVPAIRRLRDACSPLISPIDRLRVELDEIWEGGANVATFEGKKMFVGIIRLMHSELSQASEKNPHYDSLPSKYQQLDKQFAANIFVDVPNIGGEIEIWDVPEVGSSMLDGSIKCSLSRNKLSTPLVIKVESGDLVIFNSRRPHSVRSFPYGIRVSVQCFIGYMKNEGLLFWN